MNRLESAQYNPSNAGPGLGAEGIFSVSGITYDGIGYMYDPEASQVYPEFYHKDHLGNVRLAFTDRNKDGKVELLGPTSEITQQNDYYPFGMRQEGDSLVFHQELGSNRYRYNGKEFSEELGLYAYGYRYYDPAIGRFTGVDSIADQFPHVSTYNYAENDPVVNIDLHGLQKVNVNFIGMMSRNDGRTLAVAGEAQLNIGNQNRIDYKLFINDGNGISGSYSQSDGFGTAATNFGPSSYGEAFLRLTVPVVLKFLG